jgi:hypothetical protein
MTVLDPTGHITIDRPRAGDRVFVWLPLAVRSEDWLDRALRLLDEARALADARRSVSAPTEQYIRDWWESQKQSAPNNAAPD